MGNLIWGGIMLIGGLSGSFALRGTNSTVGLAVIGGIFCLIGIFQLMNGGGKEKNTRRPSRGSRTKKTTRKIPRKASVRPEEDTEEHNPRRIDD